MLSHAIVYVCYSNKNMCVILKKKFKNVLYFLDDVLLDDDGEETNDEEEFLKEPETELLDESTTGRTSISSILSI